MKRFCVLASVALAVSCAFAIEDEPEVVTKWEGSSLELLGKKLADGTDVKECHVRTSDGKTYESYSKNRSPGEFLVRKNFCGWRAKEIELEYAGMWSLITVPNNGTESEKRFKVVVIRGVSLLPARNIDAYPGNWATVWFGGNGSDVRACNLSATGHPELRYDLLKDVNENVVRHGPCGVRLHLNGTDDIQWEFTRQIGDYVIEKSIFFTKVPYVSPDEDQPKVLRYTWNLGQKAKIELKDNDIFLCQLMKPDGTITPVIVGKCVYPIAAVTQFHRGVWIANVMKKGKMDSLNVEIHVKTWDLQALNASVSRGPGDAINLLCRSGWNTLKFCFFSRPDLRRIHMSVGAGNDRYAYYGDGFQESDERRYGDCGLTIMKPNSEDIGLWTCSIGIEETVRSAKMEVSLSRAARSYQVQSPKVFVHHGDRFEIGCSVNARLDYCWLTSPNGTMYSVLSSAVSNTTLERTGNGLIVGECLAIVPRSSESDNGGWTCHLGVSGGAEVEGKVEVQLTDSYLIPVEPRVSRSEKTKLSCRTFDRDESELSYCRWVRPNGVGIGAEDAPRYEIKTSLSSCELTLLEFKPEDVGTWTCVAMMTRVAQSEETARIHVTDDGARAAYTSNLLSMILGSVVVVAAIVAAFFGGLYWYKKRNGPPVDIKYPPPYDPEDFQLPRSVQSNSNNPTLDKEYKY